MYFEGTQDFIQSRGCQEHEKKVFHDKDCLKIELLLLLQTTSCCESLKNVITFKLERGMSVLFLTKITSIIKLSNLSLDSLIRL